MSKLMSEKLFYIKDYRSNFYRLDSRDQLVAAGSENEATVFSFVEANRRIGAGHKSKFYFMIPVDDGDEEEEKTIPATNEEKNIAEEIIPASEETIDVTEEITPATNVATSSDNMESAFSIKELVETEVSMSAARVKEDYDLSGIDWEEYLTNFAFIAGSVTNYKEELNQKIAEADKKICDILHYIELCDTEDDEAQNLVGLLKACRENRREYKDDLFKAEMFQKNIGTSGNVAKVKDALRSIRGLYNRVYTPRELTNLFDGGAYYAKPRREKSQPSEQTITREEKQSPDIAKEEKVMEYEKKETPYDGKENDWLEFSRRQSEFYENANQYIVNLEIEIGDIDNEIATLMSEIEHANCNVTQGYKMFKELKELQQRRTRKNTELSALYQLTGNFDMQAMAEECKRNTEKVQELLKQVQ